MNALLHQRCFNHAGREAIAKCPECGHFFCRECVTEHDDRLLCAACIRALVRPGRQPSPGFIAVLAGGRLLVAIFALWLIFHYCGQSLLDLPSVFHDRDEPGELVP